MPKVPQLSLDEMVALGDKLLKAKYAGWERKLVPLPKETYYGKCERLSVAIARLSENGYNIIVFSEMLSIGEYKGKNPKIVRFFKRVKKFYKGKEPIDENKVYEHAMETARYFLKK